MAVFTVGVPGSGKTCVLNRIFGWWKDRVDIDIDDDMRAHPSYDPANPHLVYDSVAAYAWADSRVEARFEEAIRTKATDRLIVMDGTGTKVASRIARMRFARAHGYAVGLLYVRVTLETALRRNLCRRRQVPEDILRTYYTRVDEAYALERPEADHVWVVDNDEDNQECTGVDDDDDATVAIPRAVLEEVLHGGHTSALGFGPSRPRDSSGRVLVPDGLSQVNRN